MKKILVFLLIVFAFVIVSCNSIIEEIVKSGSTSYSKSELKDGIKVFEKYDFKSGDYTVIGIEMWGDSNTTSNFFIDDIATLEQLKVKWVFHKPAMPTKRIYTHSVMVLKNKKVVNQFGLDLSRSREVDAIRTSGGALWFDIDLLKGYAPLFEHKQTFSTIEEGRKYINQTLQDDNFVYGSLPPWYLFDGYLHFADTSICDMEDKSRSRSDKVEEKLSRYYGKNNFQVKWSQCRFNRDNPQTICIDEYELACNKTLSKKFDDFLIIQVWKEFDELTWTFWKKVK